MAEIPGLRAPIPVLKRIRQISKDIHIHKEQCIHLRDRTSILRTTLQDIFYREPDNAKILRAADAIDDILRRLHDHMLEWIELGRVGCFLKQSDISRELSMLERDLEITGLRFSITKVMECVRARNSFRMAQAKDKAQLSETIRSIITSRKDMDVIIKLRHLKPEAVKSIMESAQNALYTDSYNSVKSRQDRFALKNGLRELWQCTGILPPLLNFMKGVKKIGVSPVGKRNFYDIWKGEWLGATVVLKCLGKVGWLDQATEKEFYNEISTWRRLYHPRVEELYGICFLGPYLYIVSPWTENWNAIRYLHANPQADRAKLLAEAATGLAYLHRQTPLIIHGDFRAACILIAESGKAQITDYGMPRLEEISDAQASRPLSSTGAVRWMAPELVNPGLIGHETPQPTTATDTWSFGMVSYEVFSLARPYAHCSLDEEVIKEIERGFRHKRTFAMAMTGRLTNAVWGLTNDCWSHNPLNRPTMLRVASSINTPDRRQENRRVALNSANSVIATTSYTRAQSTTLNSRMRNRKEFLFNKYCIH
ncbi:hypothetical protein FRC02_011428 [Tulasnella sp. 418]|nr:hypothetical protein FRC02_011428 [Tulasnella sp. 418]